MQRENAAMQMTPVATVHSPRTEAIDDDWDTITSTIEIDAERFPPESVRGLDEFSHLEVVFVFDQRDPTAVQTGARHPRDNPEWPTVGIFAQRNSNRTNLLGVTVCRLLQVDGLTLTVQGLDAIDGTPVLDIKPYVREYAPRGEIRQPGWVTELMRNYWSS
jgi:tRNA-Thr(GGU) m(6)t(6)A37 methyltransferase TsaA